MRRVPEAEALQYKFQSCVVVGLEVQDRQSNLNAGSIQKMDLELPVLKQPLVTNRITSPGPTTEVPACLTG